MNINWEVEMFTKRFTDLTEEEIMFIKEANAAPGVASRNNFSMADKYKVLTNFYLAKQIEASSKASDRHSKAMFWLTIMLLLASVAQAIYTAIGLYSKQI